MNKTILIIASVLIVIIGGYFLLRGSYQTPKTGPATGAPTNSPSSSETKEITVVGTDFSFNPSAITVKTGEKVKLTFQNNGGTLHNLIIEGLGVSTKTIGSGKTDTVEFVAPISGTYTFLCLLPGHRAAGMEGSLIVE